LRTQGNRWMTIASTLNVVPGIIISCKSGDKKEELGRQISEEDELNECRLEDLSKIVVAEN